MTLTSEPQNLLTVQNESMEAEKIDSPTEPSSSKKRGSVEETPQDIAARWNKQSSTLISKVPSTGGSRHPGGWDKGRSQSISEPERRKEEEYPDGGDASMPTSAALSSRSFSLVGLPQGPGPLHLAAKYVVVVVVVVVVVLLIFPLSKPPKFFKFIIPTNLHFKVWVILLLLLTLLQYKFHP